MITALFLFIASAVYPPGGACDVTESPKRTFRIESYGVQPHANWIVPHDKKASRVPLPDPPHASKLYPYQLSVSPDEQWIVLDQKQYHGANAMWLYERTAPFHYAEVKPSPFSEQAWRFLDAQEHCKFTIDDSVCIIRISDWPKAGSRVRKIAVYGDTQRTTVSTTNENAPLISLYGDDDKTSVDLWYCYYDLKKHRFYLDAALRNHNRGRINPSHHK